MVGLSLRIRSLDAAHPAGSKEILRFSRIAPSVMMSGMQAAIDTTDSRAMLRMDLVLYVGIALLSSTL